VSVLVSENKMEIISQSGSMMLRSKENSKKLIEVSFFFFSPFQEFTFLHKQFAEGISATIRGEYAKQVERGRNEEIEKSAPPVKFGKASLPLMMQVQ